MRLIFSVAVVRHAHIYLNLLKLSKIVRNWNQVLPKGFEDQVIMFSSFFSFITSYFMTFFYN